MKATVFLLLATFAVAAPDWSTLSPEEFSRRPETSERIDPTHFDGAVMATAIFHETNRVRRRLGLPLFTHLAKLDAAADLKASVGVFESELSHESALPPVTPADRVKSTGLDYARVAENLARLPSYDLPEGVKQLGVRKKSNGREEFYRLDTGRAVELHTYAGFAEYIVDSWMKSPGHRANLVHPALVSLGCAARPCLSPVTGHEQIYGVQVFFTPAR